MKSFYVMQIRNRENNMSSIFLREIRQRTQGTPAVLMPERKKEIETAANHIRNQHGIKTANFDLIEFLTLDYSFEVQSRLLDDDTTALLLVDEKNIVPGSSSHRVMIINKRIVDDDASFRRRRFICAHEFGHFILHRKKNQAVYALRDTVNKSSAIEQEAEYFAYCLLMPADLINNLYNREDARSDVENIKRKYGFSMGDLVAELFNVTKRTAIWRLKDLKKTENLETKAE